METSYMIFSKKDQEKGLHIKLLNTLLEFNSESSDYFLEILIKTEDFDEVRIE